MPATFCPGIHGQRSFRSRSGRREASATISMQLHRTAARAVRGIALEGPAGDDVLGVEHRLTNLLEHDPGGSRGAAIRKSRPRSPSTTSRRRGRIASGKAGSTRRPRRAARSALRSRKADRPKERAESTSIRRSTSLSGRRSPRAMEPNRARRVRPRARSSSSRRCNVCRTRLRSFAPRGWDRLDLAALAPSPCHGIGVPVESQVPNDFDCAQVKGQGRELRAAGGIPDR